MQGIEVYTLVEQSRTP